MCQQDTKASKSFANRYFKDKTIETNIKTISIDYNEAD